LEKIIGIQPQKKNSQSLSLEVICKNPPICQAIVTVPTSIVKTLYHAAVISLQHTTETDGFKKGAVPAQYIQHNLQPSLIAHLKEFICKYYVINFLYKEIRTHKIPIAGEPHLVSIDLNLKDNARFCFKFTQFQPITIYEWKYLPFKAPKRKNYKDLDRQVEKFIHEEQEKESNYHTNEISCGDWIGFTLAPVDHNQRLLFSDDAQQFWFKLDQEEVENSLRSLFYHKKKGDSFFTDDATLQEYFSEHLIPSYSFFITITDIIPYAFFCLNKFKRFFKEKTNKNMHKKLIEVFSYRNDISQRLAMVEEAFKLLLSKHHFTVPQYLILRQQDLILQSIRQNPDFNVYRTQHDFKEKVEQLAKKQMQEILLLDQLSYHENIDASSDDIVRYLNFTSRNRMKEFLYFKPPSFKKNGQELPIPDQQLKQPCIREKTINTIIYHLMKQ